MIHRIHPNQSLILLLLIKFIQAPTDFQMPIYIYHRNRVPIVRSTFLNLLELL